MTNFVLQNFVVGTATIIYITTVVKLTLVFYKWLFSGGDDR